MNAGHEKGYICVSAAPMRAESRHASEMVNELMMGDAVKVFERGKDWHRVEAPDDYQGYIHHEHITEAGDAYERLPKAFVTVPFAFVVDEAGLPVFDASVGCVVGLGRESGGLIEVSAPDLRKGWLASSSILSLSAPSGRFDGKSALRFISSLNGVPYLWGGTTPRGIDCSGLIQLAGRMQGYRFPRDAKDQALVGERLPDTNLSTLEAGDLLFFGEGEKVTHVALYAGDSVYWHASGRVRQNSLDPHHSLYDVYRRRTLKWATRL